MRMNSFRSRCGPRAFTLLELIVVVVILGVLAAIAVPTFQRVLKKTHLEKAETTLSAVVRETLALSAFEEAQLISETNIRSAVNDLGSKSAAFVSGVQATARSSYQIVLGAWEFSGDAQTISAFRGGTPEGSSVGMALNVPGSGCAFAVSEGASVRAWSVSGVEPANCSGSAAYLTPEELLELDSPTPVPGLKTAFGCSVPSGGLGWGITFDSGLVDVFINGAYAGRHASGACLPGSASDTLLITAALGAQPGWPGGAGGVFDDGGLDLPTEPAEAPPAITSEPVTSDGATPILVQWALPSSMTTATISRQTVGQTTWQTVGTVTGTHTYNTPAAGHYIYKAESVATGQPNTSAVTITAVKTSAPAAVTSDGGSGAKPAVVAIDKTASITWGAVPSSLKAPVTGYNVYRSVRGGSYGLVGTTASTSFTNAGLTLGEYCYKVSSYGPAGESARSSESCVTLNAVWGERSAVRSKLTASDGSTTAQLGSSVFIDATTMVVGAPQEGGKGAAYVFTRNGDVWSEQAKLVALDGAAGDGFGFSVAVSGDTISVGAPYADEKGLDAGAAYVFARNGSTWSQQAKLVANDGFVKDYLGISVALDGNTVVVGSYYDDDKGADSGSVYVYARNGSSWSQQAKLLASNGAPNDFFGYSVSVEGSTIVAGAHWADAKGVDSGAVYVFTKSGAVWKEQAKLTAHDGAEQDYFGYSISLSGDTVVVGAHWEDAKGNNSGSAYVFTRTGDAWSEQAKLAASDGSGHDVFGNSVSISGETIVIGAYQDDDRGTNSGSAYVFTRTGEAWLQKTKLIVSDGATDDYFGYSVSISGDNIVSGAHQDDDKGTDSGSIYVFKP